MISLVLLGLLGGCTSQVGAPRGFDQQFQSVTDTARLVKNATYLKKSGRLELALVELEEARLRDPKNLELLDLLIQCYEDLGEFDRAEDLYQEALAQGDNQALENNRCFSIYLQGRLEQAEVCFRKVLSRHPENQTARNNLGLVLARMGREAEALALWRETLNDEEARQRLGQALTALGKEVPPSLAASAPPPSAASSSRSQVMAPSRPLASAGHGSRNPGPTLASAPETQTPPVVKPPVAATPIRPQAAASPPLASLMPASVPPPENQRPKKVKPPVAEAPLLKETAAAGNASPAPLAAPSKPADSTPLARTEATPVPVQVNPIGRDSQAGNVQTTVSAAPAEPTNPQVAPPSDTFTLTAGELLNTRIELKNGNGAPDQARKTRSLLSGEGFTVVDIGNHIDFGLDETVITFRPEAARVALVLAHQFFPGARLEPGGKVSPQADVRVSLGRDRLTEPLLTGSPRPVSAVKTAASPPPVQTSPPVSLPRGAANDRPTLPETASASPTTAQDIYQARIELRNGNGVKGQARDLRSRLALEGFNVVGIGNHLDFGLEQTVIAYRPEAARAAQALAKNFFPQAILEPQKEGQLPPGTDIRVSLGHDLTSGQGPLAQAGL
ncbi:MAG: LytR C-terminal domain-containing protein [Desulfobaccales bacterium]